MYILSGVFAAALSDVHDYLMFNSVNKLVTVLVTPYDVMSRSNTGFESSVRSAGSVRKIITDLTI